MVKSLILFALVVAGCSSYPTIPRQAEATALVWAFYGNSKEVAAPAIEWIDGARLNCGDSIDGTYRGFYRRLVPIEIVLGIAPQCVVGAFWEEAYMAQVAHVVDFKYAASAFAHELAHAHLFRRTGDGDGAHAGPMFQPGGAVEQADAALVQAGIQ